MKLATFEQLRKCADAPKRYILGLLGDITGTVADALDEVIKNTDDAAADLQKQINGKANTNHGTHVPSVCTSITDWNSATANGWYMASGAANAPATGSAWYFGRVIAHNTNYLIQEVYQFTASANARDIPKYIRAKTNGVWGEWTNVTVAKAVPADAKFTDTTYAAATASSAGLMSAADKEKLNGIAAGANNYTHPSTHAASMIVQDATHRFVSDAEKSTWNGKADRSASTSVTIPISGWGSDSTAGYPKYYDIAVSGVTANDRAAVTITPGSLAAAKACGMCQTNETLAGKIRIRAASVPTSPITAQYWVEKGKG